MKHLTMNFAKQLIGKTVQWQARAYEGKYQGTAKIVSVDENEKNPLKVETIAGDNLAYAFVDRYGLGESHITFPEDKGDRCLSYSDGDRVVYLISIDGELADSKYTVQFETSNEIIRRNIDAIDDLEAIALSECEFDNLPNRKDIKNICVIRRKLDDGIEICNIIKFEKIRDIVDTRFVLYSESRHAFYEEKTGNWSRNMKFAKYIQYYNTIELAMEASKRVKESRITIARLVWEEDKEYPETEKLLVRQYFNDDNHFYSWNDFYYSKELSKEQILELEKTGELYK